MKLPIPSRYRALLISAASALALGSAEGALTLTIDTLSHTFVWSGAATGDLIPVTAWENENFRLGDGSFNGGTTAGSGAGAITITNSGSSSFTQQTSGSVYIASNTAAGTFYAYIGNAFGGSSGADVRFNFTTDGLAYSYSWVGIPQNHLEFYGTLDGRELFVQRLDGTQWVNVGAAIGEVVVVPEASSSLMMLGGVSGLLLRRRRA